MKDYQPEVRSSDIHNKKEKKYFREKKISSEIEVEDEAEYRCYGR